MSTENKYAVVGLGGIFPEAKDLSQFWDNIVQKRVSIRPLPEGSMEREVFYRPECRHKADKGDRSYTDLWATLEPLDFDAQRFRIPPTVATHMDANQKLSLLVAEQALSFGGLGGVARDRVAVLMGNTMVGQTHHDAVARFGCDKFEYYLRKDPVITERLTPQEQSQVLAQVRARIVGDTLGVTEDTAPGVLPNIIAARVSSVFDLRGHAFVIDAACASALAAIICGIQQLRLGECDAVLCGAADLHNEEIGRVYFSGMGALSAEGSFPFDERASGFVPGDGAGVVLLKRLEDAIAASDRIFAVITGYGQVSDGKGKAIAAPNQIGQAEAIRRAWAMAGALADTIELIEAHGTATQVGDLSEVSALKRCFSALGAEGASYCGIGSVKSNIGHLKSAAGIAGFLKAALALGHKVLPPTAGFKTENPKLELRGSPFYVLSEARDWAAREHPRRAGVSAFGFGGANYHIAMEEYREHDYSGAAKGRSSARPGTDGSGKGGVGVREVAAAALGARAEGSGAAASPGFATASSAPALLEPLCFSGDSAAELAIELEGFLTALRRSGAEPMQRVLAQNLKARASKSVRLALLYRSLEDLEAKALLVKAWAREPWGAAALRPKGIALESGPPIEPGRVAVLFPGQGSQYPDMLGALAERFPAAQQVYARADACWQELAGHCVSELIDSSQRGPDETEALLRRTENTHPALVVSSLACYRLLEEMGLEPGVLVGHSVGEFTALAAARMLSFADALGLVHARGSAFAAVPEPERGAMLALPASVEESLCLIHESATDLTVANVNAPRQTIVCGHEGEVLRLVDYCANKGIKAVRLNVSHAFHSPLMAKAELRFRESLGRTEFCRGRTRVIANASGEYYGDTTTDLRAALGTQITNPVYFARSIRRLYEDGFRLFVEVGPSSVLSSLTRECLAESSVTVLSSDSRRGDSVEAFLRMVCGLFAAGVAIDPTASASRVRSRPAPLHVQASEPGAAAASSEEPAPGHLAASSEEPAPGHLAASSAAKTSIKSPGVVDPTERLTLVPPAQPEQSRIVYSGVSVGLPGSFKDSFRDDNFEQLFEGHNLIERLSDTERQRLVDLRISKVVKSERGASFATLTSLSEVIQLAGKIGRLDLGQDYQLNEKDIVNMSSAIAQAVAAGYEALRDAHIPLVHEYSRTAAGGSILPERWALPQEMQRHTGVIFANGFPMVDPIIREVSRHLSYRLGCKLREDLFEFYDTLIAKVSDRESRKLLADWYSLNRSRLTAVPGQGEVYSFNHHLMTQIAMQANNRLARFINARGPNFQINAACSSAATAVTLAEELIRGGRAKRMIVIGADDPSSEYSLPYLGAGFLSTGACSNEGDLHKAALPFDRRRNGMIMGAGAVGIVVEADAECQRRGVVPVCDVLGTHCFNTAGHGSQLDIPRYAEELDMFMTRMEAQHGLVRHSLAKSLVYLSHETYTPPRGGCSEAEAVALRHVFGASFSEIEVSNTKGMTGHTMGASIEEAVAAKALQFGKAPPVVNHKEPDAALEGLRLSVGASADFEYALRMAAGFGSQGNYILLGRRARGEARIEDPAKYQGWLGSISGLERPELSHRGRVLVVNDARPGSVVVDRPNVDSSRPGSRSSVRVPVNPVPDLGDLVASADQIPAALTEADGEARGAVRSDSTASRSAASRLGLDARKVVLEVVAESTGYPQSILELDMELEADLGVDTVKQATVLGRLAERFELSDFGGVRLSDYPTLRSIVEFFESHGAGPAAAAPREHEMPVEPSAARARPGLSSFGGKGLVVADEAEVTGELYAIVGELCPYPAEMLEADLKLDGDLMLSRTQRSAIDAALRERFGLVKTWESPREVTLGDLARALLGMLRSQAAFVGGAQWLGRQVLVLCPAAAEQAPAPPLAGKFLWILGDDPHCVASLARGFEARDATVKQFVFPASGSADEVGGELDRLLAGQMPQIIVDLTACPASTNIFDEKPEAVLAAIARGADCRFALWKRLRAMSIQPKRVLAVTALDGAFALGRVPQASVSALYGLHQGFYKGIRKEWPESRVSILDLPPSGWDGDAREATELTLRELETEGVGVEVCYVDGERHRVVVTDGSWEDTATSRGFGADEVVIATGGGAGVTARIVVELARQCPARFALVGRTELDPAARGFKLDDESVVSAQKAAIGPRLAASGQRVTPRLIEERFARLVRSAETFATLEQLEKLGSQVRYFQADVCDPSALEAAVAEVRRTFGPVTTLLHGAGLEISHRVEQKSPEEFRRVHAVKSLGAYQLGWLCRNEPLRRVISISSISGRFGNAAQVDYSAANSFLDVLARVERRKDVRALSLLWSGWSDFGMAWRNSFVREHAEALGLNFIDPGAGAAAALAEIAAATGPAELVVHRGLGDVADREMVDTDLGDSPFIDWAEKRGGMLTAVHRRFSPGRDGLLDDHRFAGLPFMPGVGFMEMMAEAVRLAGAPQVYPVVYRELAFLDAFKLYREEPRDVRVELAACCGPGQFRATILSPFTPRIGGRAELRSYATAVVELGGTAPAAPSLADWALEWTEETDYESILNRAKDLDQNVRLGPLLNGAGGVTTPSRRSRIRLGRAGSETLVSLPAAQLGNPRYPRERFLINPAFMDALHQAGAVLAIELTGHVCLPVGAAEFVVYDAPKQDERYRIVVQLKELSDFQVTYDMVMLRETGACCAAITGSIFQRINQ